MNPVFFRSQLISLVVAGVAFFFFSQVNIEFLKQIRLPIYVVSILVLGIVLVLGIESRGAVRWVDIFGIRLQFSEILKPFLAIAFASYLSDQTTPSKKTFFFTLAFLLSIVVLIALQPDLGTGLMYAGVGILALLVAGFPLWWFGLALLPFVVFSPLLWTMLHEYQQRRILTFLSPTTDPLGASYNGIQAIIAVGSGAFFGKGFAEGTQSGLKFLPERHTDFIFASLAEGLGFFGAIIVIVSFLFLLYRIYRIFQNSEDVFCKIFTVCGFGFLLIQFFVNIGMNIGYLPIVGVTLPFVSFGGSSLLSSFIFLGILSAMSVSQKNKHVLEIR
jgi:rod shape determining protein RodA